MSKTDKSDTRVKSASSRQRPESGTRKKDSSERQGRDSSRGRQKDKKDKNSVYDFGDF